MDEKRISRIKIYNNLKIISSLKFDSMRTIFEINFNEI